MSFFLDYQDRAETLYEGLQGVTAKIEGWSADHPQYLKVDLEVDPFALLQELNGCTLGMPEDTPFKADPFMLLAVAEPVWRFKGEFGSKDAADLFEVGDGYLGPETFTALQREAFDHVCRVLDRLYKGLTEDWDAIGDAVYQINLDETLELPSGVKVPPGGEHLEIEVRKGSTHYEFLPLSDEYNEEGEYPCYWSVKDGEQYAGELTVTISDSESELAEFDTDGIVVWHDEAELAAIINRMIDEHGGLGQYIPAEEKAA